MKTMSSSIMAAHDVEFSPDAQRDATSSYERLTPTQRDTAVRLYIPSRRLQVGERAYDCTVTLDEYYGRDYEL